MAKLIVVMWVDADGRNHRSEYDPNNRQDVTEYKDHVGYLENNGIGYTETEVDA
jgi:hypothetical protein